MGLDLWFGFQGALFGVDGDRDEDDAVGAEGVALAEDIGGDFVVAVWSRKTSPQATGSSSQAFWSSMQRGSRCGGRIGGGQGGRGRREGQ